MATTAQRDTSLIPISIGVLVVHLVLIFYSALFFTSHIPVPKDRDRLVVKTVKLNPKQNQFNPPKQIAAPILPDPIPEPIAEVEPAKPEPLPEPEKVPEKAPEPIPEPAPTPEPKPEPKPVTPKPTPKKKPVLKKTAPKTPPKPIKKPAPPKPPAPVKKDTPKKPEPKKEPPKKAPEQPQPPRPDPQIEARKQKQKALLENARSAIANVDRKSGQVKDIGSLEKVTLPSQLGELSIDMTPMGENSNLSEKEQGYRDQIARLLKLKLTLPEKGCVKVKLTLNRLGKVTDVTIIQSASSVNKAYIQKALPTLHYQPFGDNFPSKDTYTFPVTLNSE